MNRYRLGNLIVTVCLWLAGQGQCLAGNLQQEEVTTTPVYADGVLYSASTETVNHRGHLRAIDVLDPLPRVLWDAAEQVPPAGTSRTQPESVHPDNLYRTIFTNLNNLLLPLEAGQAEHLQLILGSASLAEAEILLHAVRGRRGGTPELTAGTAEDPQRLWGISRSSPVLVGGSPVDREARQRPRMLYAGAEDGMLHAFFVSRREFDNGSYLIDDPDGGTELWAYLPGSFLAQLHEQPLDDLAAPSAIHIDGTPVITEQFVDFDGDGQRTWRTLLIATGTAVQNRRSCLFVLDITNPYQPGLVWEMQLPGSGAGRTRGVNLARCNDGLSDCLYLTADFASQTGSAGLHALAVSLAEGQLLWQFTTRYAAAGPVAEATPAVPALMDLDGDERQDTLVFGDLIGRLWALDLDDGRAYGDNPVFSAPGGVDEPIGAGVAVHNNIVVFGTGGVAAASDPFQYALYAVKVSVDGGSLRWRYALQPGENVWATPVLDNFGKAMFATASDYLPSSQASEQPTTGRLVAIDNEGVESSSRETAAATLARVVIAPGIIVSVDLQGTVTQFGTASRLAGPIGGRGAVRILSWRAL